MRWTTSACKVTTMRSGGTGASDNSTIRGEATE